MTPHPHRYSTKLQRFNPFSVSLPRDFQRGAQCGESRLAARRRLHKEDETLFKSNITSIVFRGFHDIGNVYLHVNLLFFTLILLVYCVTICGNLLIITLVSYSKTLHTPMYFFLSQLSVSDIMLSTDITPTLLNVLQNVTASVRFLGCITQFYFFATSETSECLLLMVMSIDRYVAICSPLRYVSIMTQVLCCETAFVSWILSGSISLIVTTCVCQLQFCGPNTIDHFFCDFSPLLELSCSDTSLAQMVSTSLSIPVIGIPFIVIVLSYAKIVSSIIKISSSLGRLKAFSTCSSHLTVVSIYYGTLIVMYILPSHGHSLIISRVLAMVYTVFTPFLNPMIYSLRNKDINVALKNAVHHKSPNY
ncbi:olfactory receptor 1468-like [Gastrophryne carolinensis]